MSRRVERDHAVLAAFVKMALPVLVTEVERSGVAKFFCDFCSKVRPTTTHEEWCPVPDVVNVMRRIEGRRVADLPDQLERFEGKEPTPHPPIATGDSQQGRASSFSFSSKVEEEKL